MVKSLNSPSDCEFTNFFSSSTKIFSLAGESFIEMSEIAAVRMEITWASFPFKSCMQELCGESNVD